MFDGRLLSGIGVVTAVVEAGSFARAGDALGLTQPAVSRAVARLEARLGIRIFNRTARAISLTDDGRRFYEMVAPLFHGIEEAANAASAARGLVRGRLRVHADSTFAHYVLAPRIGAFLDLYPDLTVEVMVRDAIGDLVGEGVDLAIRFGEADAHAGEPILLTRTRVLTCASPAYVERFGPADTPDAVVAAHRCILIRDPKTGRPYEWEFQGSETTVETRVTGALTVNDTGSLLGACLAGAGLAQLLEIYARPYIDDGRLLHLLPDWSHETFPLYAYVRPSPLTTARLAAFLDFVRDITR